MTLTMNSEEALKFKVLLPGLAVGESMDLDSLLPPALSESLHIPPWLPCPLEAQALSRACRLGAANTEQQHGNEAT